MCKSGFESEKSGFESENSEFESEKSEFESEKSGFESEKSGFDYANQYLNPKNVIQIKVEKMSFSIFFLDL